MPELREGQNGRPPVACQILILKPLPGERRKSNLPMLCYRNWRSKWWRVECVGDAKACKANECRHVAEICEHYAIKSPSGAVQHMRPEVKS